MTPSPTVITGQNVMRRAVSTPAREAPLRPVPLPATPDVEVHLDVLQNEHEDPDRAALASDTEDGDGDSSDESFDYDYLDGGTVSEPDEEDLEKALVHTAVPTARRSYTNVVCGTTRDSVRLGTYDHTRRPYAGPGMLAAQIEERRAELVFLRTVWPQGPTQPAGVAPETTARTDDETLGEVGSQGVAQAPMADTDTAGTVECEVHAGASDAEGRGMDVSDNFAIFERTIA